MRRMRIAIGLIWMAITGAPLMAAPMADIMRPESGDSLIGLLALAEDGSEAFVGNHPVAHPPLKFQHRVYVRDIRPIHQRLPDKNRVGPNTGIVKALVPERVSVSCAPTRNGNIRTPRGVRVLAKWAKWFVQMNVTIQAEVAKIKDAGQRREADKTRQLLTRSREALLNYFAMLPGETRPYISTQTDEVAYASGVIAGTAILNNEAMLALSGVKHDRALILAGIRDIFLQQVRMRGRQLENAQQRAIVELQRAAREAHEHRLASENRFVMDFRRRQGVRAGGEGVWYRVDHAGRHSGLARHSVIPLVAKEMLADGTVIRDMQAEKKILNVALGDLPVTWQEAIAQTGYGGAVTVVQQGRSDTNQGVLVTMIRTFDPRNYVFPERHSLVTK